jgi:hypothetical protein
MSNDRSRRPNAYQHGIFCRTTIVPGEDPEEFEALYSALIQEWAPAGETEEDAVLSIAKAIWRKRRAQKFIQIQVTINSTNPGHPTYDEYESLAAVANTLRATPSINFGDYASRCLEADKVKNLIDKFPRTRYKSDQDWANSVIKEIETILMPKVNFRADPAYEYGKLLRSSGTFTDNFFDKELRLDERLDIMIDRAVKRLLQIKAMKQMFGQWGTEPAEDRVKKIAVKKASNG